VVVTVVDPAGRVVPGANLELRDLSTNDMRKAITSDKGSYTFVNLSLGRFSLTISKDGFESEVHNNVVSEAAQTTSVNATLKVGMISVTVEVNATATPVLETTSNAIGTTLDLKQIEDLPVEGRDLTALTQLVPGYTGTWNGLPTIAQGSNIDGVIGSPTRMKFSGNGAAPAVTSRLENVEELTIQTDQLDLNQGFGQANMQTNIVTRRGSNKYHGRIFEDFRNSALNANSWSNDVNGNPKNHLILNDFGGSIGGPIFKDKLFFFGNFSMSKQPGTIDGHNWVFTSPAQTGSYTYTGIDNASHTVNLLTIAGNSGLPTAVSDQASGAFKIANDALKNGTLGTTGDPNFQQLNFQGASPTTIYYPTVRVDYNASDKFRFNLAWNETKISQPSSVLPNFPSSLSASTAAGFKSLAYTSAFGFEWTVSPTLINSFRGGFLYNTAINAFGGNSLSGASPPPQVSWDFAAAVSDGTLNTSMNNTNFAIPTGHYYPLFSASDSLTWQHGSHTISGGFSWYREQDHYYNGVLGFPVVNLGTSSGTGFATSDPAANAFNATTLPSVTPSALAEAGALYSILTGRISSVNGSFTYSPAKNNYGQGLGAYNLDELQKAWGLFFQDSYRVKPTFTVNYGMRWDFTGADYDLTGLYHSSGPADIFGPSGVGNLFNPGSLKGTQNPQIFQNSHPYNNWNMSPQPSVGFAWNPQGGDGRLGKLLGNGGTVIRAGFSLRKFTEPQQYAWNMASDYGSFYYQSFFLNPIGAGKTGGFDPGSLILDQTPFGLGTSGPQYGTAPVNFVKSLAQSDVTFTGGVGVNGINPKIQQPYTESWNLGVQRQLGVSRALELRYVGSRSLHQWITVNPNEVNIFENGFLTEFKNAQNNLAICNANAACNANPSYANQGLPGQVALPILDAAFAGEANGPDGHFIDYTSNGSNFITDLGTTGSVGAFANTLSGISGPVPYFCNLVGSSFGPCLNNVGFSGPGAGYPINFFQSNPYAGNTATGYEVAAAYSNYNALQVDFRQRSWHGLQYDANYTWGKTLGTGTTNNWQAVSPVYTLRNLRAGYGPSVFDIRHAVNINGTYDLPFGKGKQFATRGGVVDKVVGGWTVGSIFKIQSGTPFLLQGGNQTFNDYGDGGVVLHGVTAAQLQSAVGVYHFIDSGTGKPSSSVNFINPKYLTSATGGSANPAFITPNTSPGTIGQRIFLHGPGYYSEDLSITKRIPIRESIHFTFQAEMLNAFNHPYFQPGAQEGGSGQLGGNRQNVQSNSFLLGGTPTTYRPRRIEFRANIEF